MASLDFDDRPPGGGGPIFVDSYVPGDHIGPWEPEAGNTASLHCGPVTVMARIVSVSGRSYSGEVIGFEGWDEYEFEGVKPGDRIDFTFDQVFGFNR